MQDLKIALIQADLVGERCSKPALSKTNAMWQVPTVSVWTDSAMLIGEIHASLTPRVE